MKKTTFIHQLFIVLLMATVGLGLACFANTDLSTASEVTDSGTCGANVQWTLYGDGTLVIDGTGDMTNYGYSISRPWNTGGTYDNNIKKVIIESGITSVGKNAFENTNLLTDVEFRNTGTLSINDKAFNNCNALTAIDWGTGIISPGYRSFADCNALESVTLPENVVMSGGGSSVGTGNNMFYSCDNLKNVIVECAYIGPLAFESDYALEQVTFTDPDVGFYYFDNGNGFDHPFHSNGKAVNATIVAHECSLAHKLTTVREYDVTLTFSQIAGDTTAHTGGTATCQAKAVCTKCGLEYGDLGTHNYGSLIPEAAASCTEPGTKAHYYCDVCETYFDESKNATTADALVIPALNHDIVQHEAKAPSCTEVGWDAYETCSRCDYTTYVEKPKLGHDPVQHEAKAPSCTEVGWDAYETCSRCDYTTYVEKPKLGHDPVQHEAKAPSCTEVGWDAYETCSRCDYTTYVEKNALGHDPVQHEAKAPSCTEVGWDAYETCSRCDYTTYVEKPKLGHDPVQHEAKAPTCTEVGWDAYETCSRCDYTTYVEKDALGHDPVQHEAKAPSCTEVGWDAYETCSRCDYTTYVEKPKLGHDPVQHEAKAPSCTEVGWDAYETCSRCDYTTYVEKDALGHDPVQHEAKAPSCTEVGWDAYETCSRCDYTTYVEKDALGHDSVQHEAKAPTCTEVGWDAYETCSRCDYTTYVEKPALGHSWVQKTDPAGFLKDGSSVYECSTCHATKDATALPGWANYYVKKLKVKKGKGSITVTWKKQSKANQKKFNGYQIRYATKSNMSDAKYKTAGKSSKSKKIGKLKKKTKYYVQVRTYTKTGAGTFYSKWSAKKSVKTK